MIQFFIILESVGDHVLNNNSIYFELCGLKHNVSYIYLNVSHFEFGVKQTANMNQYFYELKGSYDNDLPFSKIGEGITQNITSDMAYFDGQCNLFHYLFLISSIVTFLIGLILKPDAVYKLLKKNLADRLYAGNGTRYMFKFFSVYSIP